MRKKKDRDGETKELERTEKIERKSEDGEKRKRENRERGNREKIE
jgi:hypothetical protein